MNRAGIAAVAIFWGIIGGVVGLSLFLIKFPAAAPYVGALALAIVFLGLSALLYMAVD